MEDLTKESLGEIKELNKEIKEIVRQDTPTHKTITTEGDFEYDLRAKAYLTIDKIREALQNGLFLSDDHLYGRNKKDHKHPENCYYCIYKFKEKVIYLRCLLIGLYKKPGIISLFHVGFINKGSKEERRYTEIIKSIKEFSP